MEETVKLPAHYLLMILSVVLALIVIAFTRKVFATVVILVPAVFMFFKDSQAGENQEKWMYYWLLFSFFSIFSSFFAHIKYFGIVKIAIFYFFAFFDKEDYLKKGFDYVRDGLMKAIDKYMDLCKEKSE